MKTFTNYLLESFKYKDDNIPKHVTNKYEVQSHVSHVTELKYNKERDYLRQFKVSDKLTKAFASVLPEHNINEEVTRLDDVQMPHKKLSWQDFDKEHGEGTLKSLNIQHVPDVVKLIKFYKKDPRLTFDHNKLHPDHIDTIKNFERLSAKLSPLQEYTSTHLRHDGKKSVIKFLPSIHGKARAYLRVNKYTTDDWNGLLDDVNKHFANNPRMLAHTGSWLVHSKSRNITLAVSGDFRKDGVVHMSIPTVLSPGMSYEEEHKSIFNTAPIIID